MELQQHPLLVIVGPTAAGKTKLAIDLAIELDGLLHFSLRYFLLVLISDWFLKAKLSMQM